MPLTERATTSGKLTLISTFSGQRTRKIFFSTSGSQCSAVAHLTGWGPSQTWLNATAGRPSNAASIAAAMVPE